MYRCDYAHKLVEVDNFENGCTGEVWDRSYPYSIKGKTLAEVKQAIAEHVGCSIESISVNPCGDDPSRIDAQRTENGQGDEPSAEEMRRFEAGEIDIYVANYSFYFSESKPANFAE